MQTIFIGSTALHTDLEHLRYFVRVDYCLFSESTIDFLHFRRFSAEGIFSSASKSPCARPLPSIDGHEFRDENTALHTTT